MAINIICEEAFEKSIWCKQLLSGLTSELKKKRLHYDKYSHIDAVENNTTVYIVGTNYNWLNHAIRVCNSKGIVPIILCNQANRVIRGQYHGVCADTYNIMKQLYEHFSHEGKKEIALYGVNPLSVSDTSRMEYFLDFVQNSAHVYKNNGNLDECFKNFLPHLCNYDVVICVNNYAAISLVKKIEALDVKLLKNCTVVSCTETMISSQYKNRIAFVNQNLTQYGKAAISLSEMTENCPFVSTITITIPGIISDTMPVISSIDIHSNIDAPQADLFYDDTELSNMLKLDHLLSECTATDQQIISLLLKDETYSKIAELCYLSESTVKYHIKKYMAICQVKTKQELLDFFKNYYA